MKDRTKLLRKFFVWIKLKTENSIQPQIVQILYYTKKVFLVYLIKEHFKLIKIHF